MVKLLGLPVFRALAYQRQNAEAGEHGDGEGAKFWLRVLSEIKNRGTRDVLMLVCDLKGLPDAVGAVWGKTVVQACIVHLLRNSFKYASKKDWPQIALSHFRW